MSGRTRAIEVAVVAAAALIVLAFGSLAAQDDDDAMASLEPMEPSITIRDAWTRESMMVDLAGAAYMVIHNGSDEADTLTGASSPAAATVEIHETSMDDDGAMVMQHVGEVTLAPHADTVLEPGGYHIMLIDLVEPLVEGAELELELRFATAGSQTITVPVTGPMGLGTDDMDDPDDKEMDMGADAALETDADMSKTEDED